MKVTDQLLRIFARSILSKVTALTNLDLTRNQRARLRKSITEDIRNCGGIIYPEVTAPEVSKAAQTEAERLGVTIHTKSWRDQNAFDRGRKIFHLEHVIPISSVQKDCEEAKSEEAILKILKTRLRIAWILKREDRELTRLGYRSKRLDPEGAYLAAKIELLKHG